MYFVNQTESENSQWFELPAGEVRRGHGEEEETMCFQSGFENVNRASPPNVQW